MFLHCIKLFFLGKQSTHERIENCLASKWTDVPGDNLKPLLTRVVNIVVDITGNE